MLLVLTAVIVPANSNLKLVLQVDQEERQTNSVWIPQKAKTNSVSGKACCEMQSYQRQSIYSRRENSFKKSGKIKMLKI